MILIGTLKGARSASATVIRFVAGAIFRYLDFRTINFWAVLLFAATTFAIPLIGGALAGTVLLGVFLVAGLCRGILRVTTAATIADIRREGRDIGLSSGVYNAGLDLGSIVGPVAGGLVRRWPRSASRSADHQQRAVLWVATRRGQALATRRPPCRVKSLEAGGDFRRRATQPTDGGNRSGVRRDAPRT